MSHPEWLNQVQETKALASGAKGKSETGAALSAIADAMQADVVQQFDAGTVIGVVIQRIAFAQNAVAVSTGNAEADILRLAQIYEVNPANISLVSAAAMLNEQYEGIAGCLQLQAEPVASPGAGRVTLDKLEYLLQRQRAEGVSGSTVVAVTGVDNNGRSGVANFEVLPRTVNVAKAEFDKPWNQAKFVFRGGVSVLVLG